MGVGGKGKLAVLGGGWESPPSQPSPVKGEGVRGEGKAARPFDRPFDKLRVSGGITPISIFPVKGEEANRCLGGVVQKSPSRGKG